MKYRLLTLVAAVGVLLAGCNKDNTGETEKKTGPADIFIQMSKADISKAVTDNVEAGTTTEFSNGGMFFTNNAGEILTYIRITPNGMPTGTISINTLEKGTIIENVSEFATKLHIIGNYDFEDKLYATMAEVNAEVTDLEKQSDRPQQTYGVKNATLYGIGNIENWTGLLPAYLNYVGAGGTETADKEVQVVVSALMARFEIDEFAADNDISRKQKATFDIDSYTVAGIYINNFYYKIGLAGDLTISGNQRYEFGDDPDAYSGNRTNYTASWEKLLWDEGSWTADAGAADALNVKPLYPADPADNQTWAYNFFPDNSSQPQIVIHLKNLMVIENGSSTPTQFQADLSKTNAKHGEGWLTVKKYFDAGNGGIVNHEGGYVYLIKELTFGPDDIGSTPGGPDGPDPEEEFTVWVEVKIMPWKVRQISVGF